MEVTDSEAVSDSEEKGAPQKLHNDEIGEQANEELDQEFANLSPSHRFTTPPTTAALRVSGRSNKATGGKAERDERLGNMQYEWNKPARARSSSLIDNRVTQHLKKHNKSNVKV